MVIKVAVDIIFNFVCQVNVFGVRVSMNKIDRKVYYSSWNNDRTCDIEKNIICVDISIFAVQKTELFEH